MTDKDTDNDLREGVDDLSNGDDPFGDGDLSAAQTEKIDAVVSQACERNPAALAEAERKRRREEERNIPATDGAGNLSPGTAAVLDALTGGVGVERTDVRADRDR